MSSPIVVGVDLGLSGARACVVDGVGRRLGVGRSSGSCGSSPAGWLEPVGAAVRAALAQAGSPPVEALAVAAFGPVPVVVDAELRPLFTGTVFTSSSASAQVEGAIERDAIPDGARWELDATGFVVSTLVGRPVMDAVTAADHPMPPLRVPTPEDPRSIAGELTVGGAVLLGLPAGVPVVVGTYDSFVDLFALGMRDAGDRGVLVGSTLVIGVVTDDPPPPGLRAVPCLAPAPFVGGWTSAAGAALDWVARLTGDRGGADVAELTHRAGPGAGGLLALVHLDGERAPLWDDRARGAVLGLTAGTGPIELRRAVVDGVALTALDLTRRLAPVTGEVDRWPAAGGAFGDIALAHAVTDALGVTVEVFDLADGLGAAVLAHHALGHELRPPMLQRLDPDPVRHDRLLALDAIHDGAYDVLADRLHRLHELERTPAMEARS